MTALQSSTQGTVANPRTPNRPLRVVAIGGGTGLSTLLKGLKAYVPTPSDPAILAGAEKPMIGELSGVVTVSDDGGSSGRLRKEFNMLPPGDVRNCIVALSEDEALLSRLFQHRFSKGTGLEGHSFGNLDRKSTRLNSSHVSISYAVFCLKKKK